MQKSESLLKNKLLILLAALLTSVIGAEIFFRATYPMFATYNTEMARYARDMKIIVNDREFRHRANMRGRYYGVEIKTNSQGWREDKEYALFIFDKEKTNHRKSDTGFDFNSSCCYDLFFLYQLHKS